MTIRSVEAIPLNLPFDIGAPKPMLAGKERQMEMLLVRVETHDGVVGWGEAFGFAIWPATQAAIERLIAPLATGRDEDDIAGLHDDLARKFHLLGRSGAVMYGLSGLDIALWDIAGKKARKPLCELLGGRQRGHVKAYASLIRYADTKYVAMNVERALAKGFDAIKLHEIRTPEIEAARAAMGDGPGLMVDANCPWTAAEALAMARAIEPQDILWFEEPIWPPEDHAALAQVRRHGPLKIAAGENAQSALAFTHMFELGAVDFAQPSVTKIGGVGAVMHIAGLARAAGVAFAPHSPYVGPGLLATVHILAALDAPASLEYNFCDMGANPVGEAIVVANGHFLVPTGHGLGADPDPAVVKQFRTD
jgi:L-alanine-DL-glutamate epimerase-like enolase superfamily enzyme